MATANIGSAILAVSISIAASSAAFAAVENAPLPFPVWIQPEGSSEEGQGVIVQTGEGCAVVTAKHVLKDAIRARVRTEDGLYTGRFLTTLGGQDVVILMLDNTIQKCPDPPSVEQMHVALEHRAGTVRRLSPMGENRVTTVGWSNWSESQVLIEEKTEPGQSPLAPSDSGAPVVMDGLMMAIIVNVQSGGQFTAIRLDYIARYALVGNRPVFGIAPAADATAPSLFGSSQVSTPSASVGVGDHNSSVSDRNGSGSLIANANNGDLGAEVDLAEAYLSGGGGLTPNPARAVDLLKQAVAHNSARAEDRLAHLYSTGEAGLPRDGLVAAGLYRLAALQGDTDAQFEIGYDYAEGAGSVAQNIGEGVKWYSAAAALGEQESGAKAGVLKLKPAVSYAENNLAVMYQRGNAVVTQDKNMAYRLFRRAADHGDALAFDNLAYFYAAGEGGVSKDLRKAYELSSKAATLGIVRAQDNVGIALRDGLGVPKDLAGAVREFRLAADAGNTDAMVNLGEMYEAGAGGLNKEAGAAVKLYEAALAHQDGRSSAKLFNIYWWGRDGIPQDRFRALSILNTGAGYGSAEAEELLGQIYNEGDSVSGIAIDKKKAMDWYRKAADRHLCAAEVNVGWMLYNAYDGRPNYAGALQWYEAAFNDGCTRGATNIANMYVTGAGVVRSPSVARSWMKRAAEKGDPDAVKWLRDNPN